MGITIQASEISDHLSRYAKIKLSKFEEILFGIFFNMKGTNVPIKKL